MKKSFFTAILTAALIAAEVVAAAEPPPDSAALLSAAKIQYVKQRIAEFNGGFMIVKSREIPLEQREKLRIVFGKWVDDQLIPFLVKNGVLDDWIEMQFDKELLRLHRKSLEARDLGDALMVARECDDLARKRWPKLASAMSTPEWHQLQQSLQVSMMRILEEK